MVNLTLIRPVPRRFVISTRGLQGPPGDSATGNIDHGTLQGLGDDDHSQYLNFQRGDARYYTQSQVATLLNDKADADDTTAALASKADAAATTAALASKADSSAMTAALAGKANVSHTHPQSAITNLENDLAAKADAAAMTSALAGKANTSHTHSYTDISGLGTLATQNASAVNFNGGMISNCTITGLGTPSNSTDPATKGYVDTLIATGMKSPHAVLDCSTNPNYPAASQAGMQWVVSVAGKIGGASGKSVEVDDVIQSLAANAGGTQAAVGTSWHIAQGNIVGALLSSMNLGDVQNAATALANIGGQAASGNLTATITTNTPTNLSAGVVTSNGSDIDVVSPSTSNRVLAWNGTSIVWTSVQDQYLGVSINALKISTGLVDNSEFNRLNGCTEDIQSRLDSLKIETQTLHFVTPTVQVWCVDAKAEYIYVINGLKGLKTSAGTATISVKINGTAVSGLNAISVTTTSQDVTASGVNVVVVTGDIVTFEITAVSSAANLQCNLKFTRS